MAQRHAWPLVLAAACAAAGPSAAAPAGPADVGRELAAACAGCHRPDGRDTALPPIARLSQDRIVQLMLAYRGADQGSQIMRVVAGGLTPDEIVAIARFLAPAAGAAVPR